MAKITTITNPLTGQPAQVDQLEHTAQEIDDAIARALPGGAIDITLANKSSWSKNKIDDSVLDWAASQNIPTSGYAEPTNTDVPSSSYWLVNVLMSNTNSSWKVVVLHGITNNEVWYRVYNYGAWNAEWRKSLDDRSTPSDLGAYSKEEVNSLVHLRRLYFVSGLLLDANDDTIEGVGTATINVDTNGIARIDFNIKITQTYTTSTFDFGINPALFTAKNANIPTITPVDGGTLVMISTDSKYAEGNEYGATFQTDLGRWRPSRMYDTAGSIGGWASANLDAGMVLTGTCYGTVN